MCLSRQIAFDLFVESFGRHFVECRQVCIQQNLLSAQQQDVVRDGLDWQLKKGYSSGVLPMLYVHGLPSGMR